MKSQRIALNVGVLYTVVIIVALTFAIRASNNMVQTTIPLLARYDLSYSQFLVGVLVASLSASALVSSLLNSAIRARFRKKLFVLASIAYPLTIFLFSFSSPVSVLVFVIASGLSYGFIFPNIMTSAGLFQDRNVRERILAIYTLALGVSLIVGPALESLIVARYSLRSAFLFFVPLGIIGAVLSPFVRFPEERKVERRSSVWAHPGFKVGIYTFLVYSMSTALILSFGGIFAKQSYDASYSLVILLFAAFFTASFTTRALFSVLKIESIFPYVMLMMSISILGLVMVFLSHNIVIYALAFVILGIPHGLGMPIAMFSIGRSFTMEERNVANSYFTSTMMLMMVIMPVLGGSFLNIVGFKSLLLFITPGVIVLMMLTLKTFMSQKAQKGRSENRSELTHGGLG
ncbi:MAG: MFS transporter [Nitrososphaerota archaeon]|jgi:MFS family permease|nr:MFS transporter [Nitrososphaerota archaeon]MDG7046746.1 MFS transporter [Nitrososphaerota archaeon]MDG7047472.1 MFS transporter [Nitrososphaerota archaeon]